MELTGLIIKKVSTDKSEGLLYDGLLYEGLLYRRLNRHYLRLCRVTGELGQLDFKNAAKGSLKDFAFEDFVFSGIDFSRYREIGEKDFGLFSPEALTDFSEGFYKKNFGLCRREIQSVIEGCYIKAKGSYKITQEKPLILSVMRTLETSLDNSPLFTAEDIREKAGKLPGSAGSAGSAGKGAMETNSLYRRLVASLDNASVIHGDGLTTKLFISREGELKGIFRPENKPWTRVLIPEF
jgi:hypothetical protein